MAAGGGKQLKDLVFRFSAIDKVTAPLRKIEKLIKQVSVAAGLPKITSAFRGVGRAFAGVEDATRAIGLRLLEFGAAGVAAVAVMRRIAGAAADIVHTAPRLGVTTDQLQRIQFAAANAGVSSEALTSAISRLVKNSQKIGGLKGLELPAMLAKIADRFARMPNGIKKANAALVLFGRGGGVMVDFLSRGSAWLKTMGDRAQISESSWATRPCVEGWRSRNHSPSSAPQ